MTDTQHLDRRTLLAGAALVGGGLIAPGAARAALGNTQPVLAQINRQLPENIARIQDWIRHPGIAAENWRLDEACDYTMGLLRLAGSWPGSVFTQPPVSLPAGQFGLGHGSGAHAPNEYFVVESSNPKVAGLAGCTAGFVYFLYELAGID